MSRGRSPEFAELVGFGSNQWHAPPRALVVRFGEGLTIWRYATSSAASWSKSSLYCSHIHMDAYLSGIMRDQIGCSSIHTQRPWSSCAVSPSCDVSPGQQVQYGSVKHLPGGQSVSPTHDRRFRGDLLVRGGAIVMGCRAVAIHSYQGGPCQQSSPVYSTMLNAHASNKHGVL